MGAGLPPFPVDDASLSLIETAMLPTPSGASCLTSVLDLLSGSHPDRVHQWVADGIVFDPRPCYSRDDVIAALIKEVRRLRSSDPQETPMGDPTECPGRISPNGVEVIHCWGEPHEGPHAALVCRPCMTCFGFDEHIKGCPEITADADDPGFVLLMWDNAGTAWTAEGGIPDHITGPWRPARRRHIEGER